MLPGFYNITATDLNGCTKNFTVNVVDQNCNIYLPNIFTPNGDRLNDIFRITQSGILQLNDFSIYNRWGNKVFSTTQSSIGWDGTYKGKESPAGTYMYIINGSVSNRKKQFKGTITLER